MSCFPLLVWAAVALVLFPARAGEELVLKGGELELRATWEPLSDTTYGFEKAYPAIRGLAPAEVTKRHGVESFRPFLPARPVELGEPWKLEEARLLPLLRQLHPGATVELHHDFGAGIAAHGGYALLRAVSPRHAEILFRFHAEFRFPGDAPGSQVHFTPAQFQGRLVLERERGEVLRFELAVPESRANVDVNVGVGDAVSADIGRTRLELTGGVAPDLGPGWREIALEDARRRLEREFYACAAIPWLDLPTALAQARAQDKPLHVVMLFGSLLDESC
ncbi:MAG: hypothetical protein ABL998_02960 [Planctomycetota bacterium]